MRVRDSAVLGFCKLFIQGSMTREDSEMGQPGILLVSGYEGGVQPLSIGAAAAYLINAGFQPVCLDRFVDYSCNDRFTDDVDLIAISMQLFQSVAPGVDIAKLARLRNPRATIVMFGQHAGIHAERLLGSYCDYVIRGDWETALVALAQHLSGESISLDLPGLCRKGSIVAPYIHRSNYLPPTRSMLPDLSSYAYPEFELFKTSCGATPIIGNIETSRGCHHACSYCSVFAATGRKVNFIPQAVVMDDIRHVVDAGASHIYFADAEFLNSKRRGLQIVRQMKEEYPHLTFDITTRADHILEARDVILELRELGCMFVTSALEFPSQRVLDAVQKDLTVAEIEMAVHYCHEIGLPMNATFIPFNPWVTLDELERFQEWIDQVGLSDTINPIQYETRLYLYKGSPLLMHPDVQRLQLTEYEFHFEWAHPDPRVDRLFEDIVSPLEEGVFKRCCIKC